MDEVPETFPSPESTTPLPTLPKEAVATRQCPFRGADGREIMLQFSRMPRSNVASAHFILQGETKPSIPAGVKVETYNPVDGVWFELLPHHNRTFWIIIGQGIQVTYNGAVIARNEPRLDYLSKTRRWLVDFRDI